MLCRGQCLIPLESNFPVRTTILPPGQTAPANLVRQAKKRYKESAPWQETATKIEAALGLTPANPSVLKSKSIAATR